MEPFTPNDHKAIEMAISLMCSAYSISERRGKDTNWKAFSARTKECLALLNRNGITARTFRLVDEDSKDNAPSAN